MQSEVLGFLSPEDIHRLPPNHSDSRLHWALKRFHKNFNKQLQYSLFFVFSEKKASNFPGQDNERKISALLA